MSELMLFDSTTTERADRGVDGDAMQAIPELVNEIRRVISYASQWDTRERVELFNAIKLAIHEESPFATEPVDCVLWVPFTSVSANDYNPNSVAPPEMELLRISIESDGYTQPIVTWDTGDGREVVDGFHRNRVGRECEAVRRRVHGYLPVVAINADRQDKNDRIAATIRHNRARGKHAVNAMSDIVVELKRRNWSNEKISRELGMDQDEILRLCQITGLYELFSDQDFSKSWDVEGNSSETELISELTDDINTYGDEVDDIRTVNTSDDGRVFHTYDKWECYKAGFYATCKDGMSKDDGEQAMADLLKDHTAFDAAVAHVVDNWKHSCEHYLTNTAMNRIAWLGQAAACYAKGIPSTFRGGFSLLTPSEQAAADAIALKHLNRWLRNNNRPEVGINEAAPDRQSTIY